MKMADAKQKRNEQLKRWLGSETDLEPPVLKKKKTKVKFDDGAVFLAACSSGDTEEVLRMLDRGADINYANVDGLTALHQMTVAGNHGKERGEQTFLSCHLNPSPLVILSLACLSPYDAKAQLTVAH
ncbi:protein phosphatase 1 regulatory subunit 12A isoform X1 [Lates japonicus]|uniref:Protein phosphatase 1 regulatory subunit 12A isoform X1 n=1 Tax=Lates japonicus TaxID=270547 RepID=A0AAD3M6I2_LATJO|nr:protein phosphatase 1 regulatory subunit 12A isoform X1 [Lates japonicus]